MLSRIAESLFWIGRYVERADDTARILDVHLQYLFEDPWTDEDTVGRSLLSVMDQPLPQTGEITYREVMKRLAFDTRSPSAIAGSLSAARENARRAREVITSEMWECLNTTHNQLPGQARKARAHDYLHWVRERGAIVSGLMDSATSRDDTWQFLVLGRSIERADMTARLLATQALAEGVGPGWKTLLSSCGAYESFLRTFRGRADDERAAGFLLLDRLFPRSIVYALQRAERCLQELEPSKVRAGYPDTARRVLGQVRTGLEYRPLADLMEDLAAEMEGVQRACSAASDAIRLRYFPSGSQISWVGETL
ncbi:MAG: alpha-E domain-containing protein [Cellulomonadaceae bacterium]